ncbi:MAG: hypothetical protein ABJA66_09645 [Actinomycetota bacterium]
MQFQTAKLFFEAKFMRKISILLILFLFSVFYCFAQVKENEYKKVDWMFSDKDFSLNIKEVQIKKGNHTFETSRRSSDKTKSLLIKKAEALYPKEIEQQNLPPTINKDLYEKDVFSPTVEEKPFWSTSSFNDVKIAGVISTRAISFYQDLLVAFRNNKKPTSIKMSRTSFSYSASVKHFNNYEIANEKYENVNIVFMKLNWLQYCGNLCAMGFGREEIVVFDKNNNPVAMFFNYSDQTWVS